MTDKNKNKKNSHSDFLRYRKGEMTGMERNSFERELQKDPFAEEASEGLDSLTPEETLHDLKRLQNRIVSRASARGGFFYYRIAASVAVLMVISTMFILIERNKTYEKISESDKSPEPFEISKGEPVRQQIAGNSQGKATGGLSEKLVEGTVTGAAVSEIKQETITAEDKEHSKKYEIDSVTDNSIKAVEVYLAEERMAAPVAMTKARSSEFTQVKGKVIASEDNMPVPGASIYVKGTTSGVVTDASGNFSITLPDSEKRTLVANYIGMEPKEFEAKTDKPLQVMLDPSLSSLSEVVVVGYGVKRDEDLTSEYVAPQPLNGRQSFNKYIEENIIRPDTTTEGQRVVVVINFTVLSDGRVDSIKIVRSPGKAFSDEAIRLIKSGPEWKPAEENGKPITDDVRMRIVFR